MKKSLTNYAIKMLGLTVIAFIAMLKPAFCQEPAIDNDLITYSMAVSPNQQVKFRVPLDIRSGDRITGSMISVKSVQGEVIEIDGKQTKISNRLISFLVPAGLTSLPFLIKNSAGQVIERGQIPVGVYSYFDIFVEPPVWVWSYFDTRWQEPVGGLGTKFSPQAVGQPGQTLKITGSFDGNAANTNVLLNGQACELIAESPRGSFVGVPNDATAGVSNININENNISETHKLNIAILNLNAGKTSLLKGEKSTIKVSVKGLEGLEKGNECKLEFTNHSPSVIRIKNSATNSINKTIPEGQTGEYKFSFSIVGITQGNYMLEGILLCSPPSKIFLNAAPEGPEHKKWREKFEQALVDRLKEEGFDKDEIDKIIKDSFKGIWGIIKNLWRLYKAKRAIDKAKEDAGPKPDRDK